MPEGEDVIMYSENTKKMWIDNRISSMPKDFDDKGGVTHWHPLIEKPLF